MPTILDLPDGTELELPDNMSDAQREQLRVRLAERFPDFQPSTPQAPAQQPTPEEQVDPGFLTRFRQRFNSGARKFGRGVQAIAGNEQLNNGRTARQQAGRNLEGLLRSFTSPVGGDFAAAGGSFITGNGFNVAEQRARRQELERDNGQVATLAAKGASGVAAARALITRAPVLNPANAATRTGAAGALAGEGAILAGGATAAEGGNVQQTVKSAATGAILSPLVTAGVSGTGNLVRNLGERAVGAVKNVLGQGGQLSEKSVRSIASRIDLSENQVRDAIEQFTAQTGRAPSIAEALEPDTLRRFVSLSQNREAAAAVFREAQEAALDARPETLGRSILGQEGTPLSAEQVRLAAEEAFTVVKQEINGTVIPRDIVAGISDIPEARQALGVSLWRRLGKVDDGTEELTIELADDIRAALNPSKAPANFGSGGRAALAQLREQVETGLRQSSDTYDEAFKLRTEALRFHEGIGVGSNANSVTRQDLEFDQTRAATDRQQLGNDLGGITEDQAVAARQAGIAQGRTNDLVDRATRSPASAIRVADELATSDSVARTTITNNADEAERLRALGQAEAGAQESLDQLARRSPNQDEFKRTARELFSLPVLASGRISGGGLVDRLEQFVQSRIRPLGISDNAVREVAKGLTSNDDEVINQILDRLRARGVSQEVILQLGQDLQAFVATNVGAEESQ